MNFDPPRPVWRCSDRLASCKSGWMLNGPMRSGTRGVLAIHNNIARRHQIFAILPRKRLSLRQIKIMVILPQKTLHIVGNQRNISNI